MHNINESKESILYHLWWWICNKEELAPISKGEILDDSQFENAVQQVKRFVSFQTYSDKEILKHYNIINDQLKITKEGLKNLTSILKVGKSAAVLYLSYFLSSI